MVQYTPDMSELYLPGCQVPDDIKTIICPVIHHLYAPSDTKQI